MRVERIKGDLIQLAKENFFSGIGHGCNCFHKMGSGIAPLIDKYTQGLASGVDKTTSFGDINKMGTRSFSTVCSKTPEGQGHVTFVYNMYTQYTTKQYDNQVCVHWDSFEKALISSITHCARSSDQDIVRFGIPLIGLGLAGGEPIDFDQRIRNVKNKLADMDNVVLYIVEFG